MSCRTFMFRIGNRWVWTCACFRTCICMKQPPTCMNAWKKAPSKVVRYVPREKRCVYIQCYEHHIQCFVNLACIWASMSRDIALLAYPGTHGAMKGKPVLGNIPCFCASEHAMPWAAGQCFLRFALQLNLTCKAFERKYACFTGLRKHNRP